MHAIEATPLTRSTGAVIAKFDRVSYLYPGTQDWALKDLSLEVKRGAFLGVIGPTGAGKTTFCLAFNGIVPQFYGGRFFGHATVAGLDTLTHPISRLAAHVGMVFEDPDTQITATSVANEVAFALENLQVPREEIRARLPEALAMVRLAGMDDRHPHELSGGEKQRLAIAAALALRPALLVLDEPTSQLDPVGKEELFATLHGLNRDHGTTIVMASHDAEELASYADRIVLLAQGSVAAVGTPDEVYRQVDLLERHGIRPPQVTMTFHLLNRALMSLDEDPGAVAIAHQAAMPLPVQLEAGVTALEELLGSTAQLPPQPMPTSRNFGPRRPGVPRSDTDPIVSVRDLTHVYEDGIVALSGVDLDIYRGDYVAIVGQNGAGKSTLVKHFLKVLTPTDGTVAIAGHDVRTLSTAQLAQRIGYVAQNPDHQIFNATVEDEVGFALRNAGVNVAPAQIGHRVDESLAAMGLLDVRHRHPLSLPKGDRARVVIAAVLAMQPDILILDEPTTGQDYTGSRHILEVTRRLHETGKTIIVITHHLYLMPEYADRAVVMGDGKIILDTPTCEAYAEVDLLKSTFLTPPQVVLLYEAVTSGELGCPPLTPAELAAWAASCIKAAHGCTA